MCATSELEIFIDLQEKDAFAELRQLFINVANEKYTPLAGVI